MRCAYCKLKLEGQKRFLCPSSHKSLYYQQEREKLINGLEGLTKLKPTDIVEGREQKLHKLPPSKDRAKLRSKTYPGIAKAMAKQWTNYFEQNKPEVTQCTLSQNNKKEEGIPPTNKNV